MRQINYGLLLAAFVVFNQLGGHAATVPLNINDNNSDEPWFSNSGGSAYTGSILSGGGSSTTMTGTGLTVLGTATPGSGFTDGNGIPDGVVVSFDAEFTITVASGGNLVDGGNNGLAIDSGVGAADQLDPNEQLLFSAIAISNETVTSDPNGYLQNTTVVVDNPLWVVLRSNDFSEGSEGATVSTDAAGTTGLTAFGVSGGGAINNNFNDGLVGLLESFYVTTDQGQWRMKGVGYQVDIAVTPIPEPASAALVFLAPGCVLASRRVTKR